MVNHRNPKGVRAPEAAYSHVAEVKAGGRLLFIAGQVGVDLDGNVPDGVEAQAANAYRNLEAILKSEGLTFANVVKLTTFLTSPDHIDGMRAARQKIVGDVKPPNTLCIISRLAAPQYKIEIEAVAAQD